LINNGNPGPVIRRNKTGIIDSLLSLLYPERCLICRTVLPGRLIVPLCSTCADTYTYAGYVCPICEQYGFELPSCKCLPGWYPIESLYCLSFYETGWRDMLHNLKYRQRRSLARPLGLWLGSEIAGATRMFFDLVVPVPLHRSRECERGYNQSELVGRSAARALGVPCVNLLKRVINTCSQTTISRRERRENIRGAFKVNGEFAPGTRILLVDDIFSTGSTMNEAASVLKNEGALVHAAAIAYNRRSRD